MNSMRLFKHFKSGYWYVAFHRGKEKSLKTRDEREARRLFKAIEREVLLGRLVKLDKNERITLKAFLIEYVDSRQDLDPDTLRMDSLALRSLQDVLGENTALRAITSKKIDHYRSVCRTRKIRRGGREVAMSPRSINTYLRHIRAALNTAVEWGYLEKAPRIKLEKVPKHHPRILRPEEREAILDHAKKTDHELWRLIEFALWTGCRREEAVNLTWQDVNLQGDSWAILRGKGDKERTVPLLPGALAAMAPVRDIGPVFQQWHKDTISHRFKSIAVACGIHDVHFHNLRHSAATGMIESGLNPLTVQAILGHTDFRTTQIYIEVVQGALHQEMKKFKFRSSSQ